jgi:hypothetical protein
MVKQRHEPSAPMTVEDSSEPGDVTDQLNEWHYRVRPARGSGGYVAWAAMTRELGDGPTDVAPGHVVRLVFVRRQ